MKGCIFYNHSNTASIWGDMSAWTNTLEKIGYDFYIAIDINNVEPNYTETKSIEGYRVSTFDEALTKLSEIHPECETVQLTMTATKNLSEFTEPVDVCYVCGPDSGSEPEFTPDHKIKLTPPNLWAIQCICGIWGKFQ